MTKAALFVLLTLAAPSVVLATVPVSLPVPVGVPGPVSVPEPSSLLLMLAGLGAGAIAARSRRRK